MIDASFGYFIRGIEVEQRKARHTLVFWLALAVPLLTAGLDITAYAVNGDDILRVKQSHTPWQHFNFHMLVMWTMLMLPMYISLQSALVTALEHQANAWKHIYSLPVPKWSIYFSKLFFFVGLFLLSTLGLILCTELAGWLLYWMKPELGIDPSTDSWFLVRNVGKTFLIGLGMTAIQFYLSFRFRNFIIPAAFGVFVSVIGVVIKSWEHSYISPYLWVYLAVRDQANATNWTNDYVWAGLLTFAVVAISGFLATYRQDID
ncbi:ABC transporter permease [Spirosoma gilvum]